jgi:hypothetical protein
MTLLTSSGSLSTARGHCKEVTKPFAYGAFTLFGGSFQKPSARLVICNFPDRLQPTPTTPLNPIQATLAGFKPERFGLVCNGYILTHISN